MPPYHSMHSKPAEIKTQVIPFPETIDFEGDNLSLVYNPYDQTRAQICPDYDRLSVERGGCFLVALNGPKGREERWIVFLKLVSPAEVGTLVPRQDFYAFRSSPVEVKTLNMVDRRTLVFYAMKPKEYADNIAQRFINALLGVNNTAKPEPDPQDDDWTSDFAILQQPQVVHPQPQSEPMPEPATEEES